MPSKRNIAIVLALAASTKREDVLMENLEHLGRAEEVSSAAVANFLGD